MLTSFVRNAGVRIFKNDLLIFLNEHEEEFLAIVREKLMALDRRTPDEESYIDIRMAALGEKIARAILDAVREFLGKC